MRLSNSVSSPRGTGRASATAPLVPIFAFALLFLSILLPSTTAYGQEPSEAEGKTYGNTPEELRPFKRFVRQPYKQFFVEPLEFTGPGRDKPEPDVGVVKIGLIAPLTHSHEQYIGEPMLRGAELAFAEANAQGGYNGKSFELVVRNDTGLWGASANEVVALSYEDSVWAIIGSVDGANTHIAIRVALKTEVAVMNVADTDPTLVETKIPWIFRNISGDRQMAYALAYHLYQERGFKHVAIVRANNRYGRFGVSEFRSSSVRLKRPAPIEINYETNYERVNPDFTRQIERLQRVNPDAIVLWADAAPAGALLPRLRDAGINTPVFACDRVVNAQFLALAGQAAEGVVAAYPYNPDADNPLLQRFKAEYARRYGGEPSVYAAHAYDGAWMLVEAVRSAGLNRYRIRDALAAMKRYQGATGTIEMDEVYADRGPIALATVRDGRFVFASLQKQPTTTEH